jgi:Telomeric single stranded DNA binding POT1/CDC13
MEASSERVCFPNVVESVLYFLDLSIVLTIPFFKLQLPQILSNHNRHHRSVFHGILAANTRSSSLLQHPSVDVIGVILGFNTPSRTKTHNWMVSCRIVDPSISTASPQQPQESDSHDEFHAISINVFRKHEKELPRFIRAGDLIRLLGAGLQVSAVPWITKFNVNSILYSMKRKYFFVLILIGVSRENAATSATYHPD